MLAEKGQGLQPAEVTADGWLSDQPFNPCRSWQGMATTSTGRERDDEGRGGRVNSAGSLNTQGQPQCQAWSTRLPKGLPTLLPMQRSWENGRNLNTQERASKDITHIV